MGPAEVLFGVLLVHTSVDGNEEEAIAWAKTVDGLGEGYMTEGSTWVPSPEYNTGKYKMHSCIAKGMSFLNVLAEEPLKYIGIVMA